MACSQRFEALTVLVVAVLTANVCALRAAERRENTSKSVDSFVPGVVGDDPAGSPRSSRRVLESPPRQPRQPGRAPAVQQLGQAHAAQRRGLRGNTPREMLPRWLSLGGDAPVYTSTATNALVGLHESLQELAKTEESKLGFPPSLQAKFENPQFLFFGGKGETWLAEQDGKPVAVKVLHDELKQHMTWRVALSNQAKMLKVIRAKQECEDSKDMRHPGGFVRSFFNRGSKHIMDCYGSNIHEPTEYGLTEIDVYLDEPLYLVLEDCGRENLGQFQARHMLAGSWTPRLVMDIYVQILEALAYLGRHPNRWVHHDLKPGNIVVKTLPDGEVEVHLVDMGDAVKGFAENQHTLTGSTRTYHPIEWGQRGKDGKMVNFAVCDEGDDTCPQSFDMFAAAEILIEMATGFTPIDTIDHMGVHKNNVFHELGEATKDIAMFVDELEVAKVFTATASPFKYGKFYSHVLTKAVECLSNDWSSRPTAKEMLSFIRAHEKLFAKGADMES